MSLSSTSNTAVSIWRPAVAASMALALPLTSAPSQVAAVVAPYDDIGGSPVHELNGAGWSCVAVTLAPFLLPPAYADTTTDGPYKAAVVHRLSLRRTIKDLRRHHITAVVPGGPLGIDLTDRLAHALGLPGSNPATSALRRDRAAQASALIAAQVAAPRGLCTNSLTEALGWAAFHHLGAYVVRPADTSATTTLRVCHTLEEIRTAWHEQRREAHRQTGDPHLVLQEHLPGRQHLVHSVTGPGRDGQPEHTVTEVWSEGPGRSDLIHRSSLLYRALSLYMLRVLDVLGIEAGTMVSRVICEPGRGPVLLEARTYPASSARDLRPSGSTSIREAIRTVLSPRAQHHAETLHVTRVLLKSPGNATINGLTLRAITSLPTVALVRGALFPGARVPGTTGPGTSPGELVLVAGSRRAIEEDYRVIRAMERVSLYQHNHGTSR